MPNNGTLVPRPTPARVLAALIAIVLIPVEKTFAEEKEPLAVVEFGAAAEWSLQSGAAGFGPNAAVEFGVIKDLLVIETGVAPLFSRDQTEWDTDLVFKKPFDLSSIVEFEPGIGPAWQRTIAGGRTTDAVAAEAVFEFMIWSTDRKIGSFIEPSYSYSFGSGHEQSLGVSAGLLFAIP